MFDSLSNRLQNVFQKLSGKGRLSEEDVEVALREVRLALLEADVNFKVVKSFIARIREAAVGEDVLGGLNPGQQVVKIVNDELVRTLGSETAWLGRAPRPPTVIMLVGLQGSGKTTTAAKLALHLRQSGQSPMLVAADVRRPAAIEQLATLGRQLDIQVHLEPADHTPVDICANGVRQARDSALNYVILDTAGRLSIDEPMMDELKQINDKVKPTEVLLVADAMTGQDAVTVAEQFHAAVPLAGLILTKIDGDARGGAALSIREVTGVPIKFLGTGEKLDGFEVFHPDRLASRILGMGDVMSLVERAEQVFDEKRTKELERKMRTASFDLEDFRQQLQEVRKLGPLSQIVGMIPGLSGVQKSLPSESAGETQLARINAVISSMTMAERRDPKILNGSRRRRIARGSGSTPQDVNQMLKQFKQMQKLMKQLAGGKMQQLAKMIR